MKNLVKAMPLSIAPLWLARLGIGLVACLLTMSMELLRPGFVVSLDEAFRDTALQLQAKPQPEDRLVVVDINEGALSDIGPWPWSRQKVADLVEILLSTYGARAVGLDIVFTEPGDTQGDARLASLAANGPVALAQILTIHRAVQSSCKGNWEAAYRALNLRRGPSMRMALLPTMPVCRGRAVWVILATNPMPMACCAGYRPAPASKAKITLTWPALCWFALTRLRLSRMVTRSACGASLTAMHSLPTPLFQPPIFCVKLPPKP